MKFAPRVPGLRLLGLDLARKTRIRDYLPLLQDSQWYSSDQLAALQLEALGKLLQFAAGNVPFYKDCIGAAGLNPEEWSSLDQLSSVPVVTKGQIRKDPARFLPECGSGERVFTRRTGGSTGDPFVYKVGVTAFSSQWAAIFRAWSWSGYQLGDPMVTLGGGSVAPVGGFSFAQKAYNTLRRNRPLPSSSLDDQSMRWNAAQMRRSQPQLVYGYPSVLYEMAVHMREHGGVPEGVRCVVTTSEMLFPKQRALLEETFSAPVFDFYGCNEVNLITAECECHDGYHIAMESCHVEILDAADQPVAPGESGRVVATGLNNTGSLFVRYDTGDLGALETSPCSCGRGLVRLKRLEGRSRDFVRSPNGKLIHGVAFNEIVLEFPWVDRYQAIQHDKERLSVNISASVEVSSIDAEALRSQVAKLSGLEVTLEFNEPFELTSGQKSRVVISRLQES